MTARTAAFSGEEAKRLDRPGLSRALAALDDYLRRRDGVLEYTNDPECMFRIQVISSRYDAVLSDGVHVRVGDRLVALHLWNEQFPPFPESGPTLAWARRVERAFDLSLRELERYLASRPQLGDAVAICGNMALASAMRSPQLLRIVRRFGFEQVAAPRPATIGEWIRHFGENAFISLLVLARNAAALRSDTLRRDRNLVFLSRRTLQRRYGRAVGTAV